MARYNKALWKPIGNGGSTPMARYDQLVLHTCVGSLFGTDNYFRNSTSKNSHFGLGGSWGPDATRGLDGVMWQWMDTRYRAAATLDGNHRVIAIECADNAPQSPADILPFTIKQQDAIVGLMVWANKTHGIPLTLAGNSLPTARGIGYHRLGCDPYRLTSGEKWSTAYGKVCPGDKRIAQIPGMIARAKRVAAGQTEEEDFMAGLYDGDETKYEAAVAKAVTAGMNASFAAWLPRMVAAMNGRANSYFPDAEVNDDIEQALVAAQQESNALLTKLLGPKTTE